MDSMSVSAYDLAGLNMLACAPLEQVAPVTTLFSDRSSLLGELLPVSRHSNDDDLHSNCGALLQLNGHIRFGNPMHARKSTTFPIQLEYKCYSQPCNACMRRLSPVCSRSQSGADQLHLRQLLTFQSSCYRFAAMHLRNCVFPPS